MHRSTLARIVFACIIVAVSASACSRAPAPTPTTIPTTVAATLSAAAPITGTPVASSCGSDAPPADPAESAAVLGAVRLNPHRASLEGKTVLLRWNSKVSGDRLLTRLGELLASKVPGIKIIRYWETDPASAVIVKSPEQSAQIAAKIVALKPGLVIASQGEGDT